MSLHLVYAIHGFLGQSSDWNEVKKKLPDCHFFCEDLFTKDSAGILEFKAQTDFLIDKIKALHKFPGKKIFIGYSLGGRLGLHILRQNPELFDHFILLSTNPGISLNEFEQKEQRKIHDRTWSEKIRQEDWQQLLTEWNSQSVFTGSLKAEPQRDADDFDLSKLKEAMLKWSLGAQDDFSESIKKNNHRIEWVVGDRDTKYVEIARGLKDKGVIKKFHLIDSGHRIWLDNPGALSDLIRLLAE